MRAAVQVHGASFGIAEAGEITIDSNARIRNLSWSGPGLCTNYFSDNAKCAPMTCVHTLAMD